MAWENTDWFRKTTWTKDDENEFFIKWKKAHKHNKTQCLRIQANYLYETNNKKLLSVALTLLQKYFDEFPDDKSDKSSSFVLLGNIYKKMGKQEIALENYKNAIDFEDIYPNVQTDAYLKYSELAIQLNKTELYESIEKLVLSRDRDLDFPINKYIKNAILAIVYKHKNNLEKANYYKNLAEEAANAEKSDFSGHKKLGLVSNRNKLLDKLMKKI